MADIKQGKIPNPTQVKVDVPAAIKAGVYANTISITESNAEIILNFILLNPADEPNGTLVSRVIISPQFVDTLAESLQALHKKAKEINEKSGGKK